jgi:hypothetical protein
VSRRPILAWAVSLVGTGLLARSMSAPAGSRRFYRQTLCVAATWTGGGLACGRVPLGTGAGQLTRRDPGAWGRAVAGPVAIGAGAFGVFYLGARVARHIPPLRTALEKVLGFAHAGSGPLLTMSTLATGAGEEIFFRGALYSAAHRRHPVIVSTAAYALSTVATRNPALVLASLVMGTLFARQRQTSGGVLTPMLTHLTWSALMLRYLPPLFEPAIEWQN